MQVRLSSGIIKTSNQPGTDIELGGRGINDVETIYITVYGDTYQIRQGDDLDLQIHKTSPGAVMVRPDDNTQTIEVG